MSNFKTLEHGICWVAQPGSPQNVDHHRQITLIESVTSWRLREEREQQGEARLREEITDAALEMEKEKCNPGIWTLPRGWKKKGSGVLLGLPEGNTSMPDSVPAFGRFVCQH